MEKNEVPAAETAEVSVLAAAKKQKAEKPAKQQTGGVVATDGSAAPQKKSYAGVIIAIIASILIIAGAVVATIVIININKGSKGGDESSKDEKGDNGKDNGKDDGKDNGKGGNGGKTEGKKNAGILDSDHYRGKADSKVLVVEYADPQCPGCAQMMPIMNSIYKKYGDKVAFVYRHYPLSYHQNGRSSAIAVEAAGKQGYFWEMLTKLFETQSSWQSLSGDNLVNKYVSLFKDVAGSKANISQFKSDLKDEKLSAKVDADAQLGKNDGLTGTPMITVNGTEVDFFSSSKGTESIIAEAIDAALDGSSKPADDDGKDDSGDDDDDDYDWSSLLDDDDDNDNDDDDDDYYSGDIDSSDSDAMSKIYEYLNSHK